MTTQLSKEAVNELINKVWEKKSMIEDRYSIEEMNETEVGGNGKPRALEGFNWEFEAEGMTVKMDVHVFEKSEELVSIGDTYETHYNGYKMDRYDLDKEKYFTEFTKLVEIAEGIKSGEVSEVEGWRVVGTNPYTLEKAGIQMYIDGSDCIVADTISNRENRLLSLYSSVHNHSDTDAWIHMLINAQNIAVEEIHQEMVAKDVFTSLFGEYDDVLNLYDVTERFSVEPELIRKVIRILEEKDIKTEKQEILESNVDEYEDMLEKALEDRRQYLRQQYEDIDIEQISS